MPTSIAELQSKVLELPAEDRARLLELLIASLEPATEIECAWLEEANRRRADVEAGRVQMVPGDEALSRVRARLK